MNTFIFDMDGTIFDTESFYYETWIDLAKIHGLDFGIEDKMNLSGKQNKEAIAYMVKNFKMDEDRAISLRAELNQLRDEKFKTLDYSLKKEGLLEILSYLKKENKKIGLASSSIKSRINFLLDREGVGGFFDTVISSDDIVKGKPDPEIFNLCMERLNSNKETTYIIEDSLAGIKAAKASGAVAVLILDLDKSDEIKSHADLVFNSLLDFLNFIKKNEIEDRRDKNFKINCPYCKTTFEKSLPTAILRHMESYNLLEDNKLDLVKCPSCGHEFRLNYRFAYTDYEKKLMFLNDPKFEKRINQLAFKSSLKLVDRIKGESMDGFIIRMTTNIEDLREKIRIYEDKKIDNIVELMKIVIKENPDFKVDTKSIKGFFYKNHNKFKIITNTGSYEMDFIEDLYKSLLDKYGDLIDEKEVSLVDKTWAYDMIKSL
ncbi:HAD-IA family hydrolase [Anaerococcus sp. WCA-380-WT-2B]|uniref:HAD-IA family hydrolase n=1 Tax=Anaerococcus porci TaxID=2652269 RepID=A0A6N7VUX0_9FIRM|nr:HAD-IA family hydrolase [Anaerococcus porci]MSS77627.1 HAD-IA family hydrolase [Anaerococcus porci]